MLLTLTGMLSNNFVLGQSTSSLIGDWSGTVETVFGAARLVFHVRESDYGLALTMDSPDQGASGIPATVVSNDPTAIKFEISVVNAVYEGSLSADGKVIDGTWSQLGSSTHVSLVLQDDDLT